MHSAAHLKQALRPGTLLSALLFACLAALPAFADEQEKPKAEKKAPAAVEKKKEAAAAKKEETKPDEKKSDAATYTLKESPFSLKTKLSGTIEATKATPIAMNLKRWADMTVIEVAPHGTSVKKGDVLISLETEKLKKAIQKLEEAMPGKEIALEASQRELETLEKTTPLTLERGRKAKVQAEADLAYYEDVTKEIQIRDAKQSVESAANYLAYAEEELKQLKKMYEQDDMTEETEEIILQRAENSVKNYRWLLEKAEERSERNLTTTIPRQHEKMERDVELTQISWRASEKSTRDALAKKRLEFEAAERSFEDSVRSLEEHKNDLEALTVKAPHDGIVYYGMAQRGKWTTASTVERKLQPGAKLSMREVVLTIVDPARVQLRVAAGETALKGLSPGQSGELVMKWNSDIKADAKVESVSFVPFYNNTFDTVVAVSGVKEKSKVMPGMAATAEITTYENKKALTVPKGAIKKDGDESTVTLKGGDLRMVETGKSDAKVTEITKGLKAGDIILLSSEKKEEEPEKKTAETPKK